MTETTLTIDDAASILDALAPSWQPLPSDRPWLLKVCTGRDSDAVLRALDDWMTTHPGQPPDPQWLLVRIARYATGAADKISRHRQAARAAINQARNR